MVKFFNKLGNILSLFKINKKKEKSSKDVTTTSLTSLSVLESVESPLKISKTLQKFLSKSNDTISSIQLNEFNKLKRTKGLYDILSLEKIERIGDTPDILIKEEIKEVKSLNRFNHIKKSKAHLISYNARLYNSTIWTQAFNKIIEKSLTKIVRKSTSTTSSSTHKENSSVTQSETQSEEKDFKLDKAICTRTEIFLQTKMKEHSTMTTTIFHEENQIFSQKKTKIEDKQKIENSSETTDYEIVNLGQIDVFNEFKTTIAKMRSVLDVMENNNENVEPPKNGEIATQTIIENFNNSTSTERIFSKSITKNDESVMAKIPIIKKINKTKENFKKKKRRHHRRSLKLNKIGRKLEKPPNYNKCVVYHITQHKNSMDRCVGTTKKENENVKETFSALHFGPIEEFPSILNKHENEKPLKKEIKFKLKRDVNVQATSRRKSLLPLMVKKSDCEKFCHRSKTQPSLSGDTTLSTTTANWMVLDPISSSPVKIRDNSLGKISQNSTKDLIKKFFSEEFTKTGFNGMTNIFDERFGHGEIPDMMVTVCLPLREIVTKLGTPPKKTIIYEDKGIYAKTEENLTKEIGVQVKNQTVSEICNTAKVSEITKANEIFLKKREIRQNKSLNKLSSFKKIFGNKATSCSNIIRPNFTNSLLKKRNQIFYSDHSTSLPEFLDNTSESFFLNLPKNRYQKRREQIAKIFDSDSSDVRCSKKNYVDKAKLLYHVQESSFYSSSKTDDRFLKKFPLQSVDSNVDIKLKENIDLINQKKYKNMKINTSKQKFEKNFGAQCDFIKCDMCGKDRKNELTKVRFENQVFVAGCTDKEQIKDDPKSVLSLFAEIETNNPTKMIDIPKNEEPKENISFTLTESLKNDGNLSGLIKDIINVCNNTFVRSRDCIVELTLYNLIKEIILEHCSHLSEQSKKKVDTILSNFLKDTKCKNENEKIKIVESAIENLVKEIDHKDESPIIINELKESSDDLLRSKSKKRHREHHSRSGDRKRHKHHHSYCDDYHKKDSEKYRTVVGKVEYEELVKRLKELEVVTKQLSKCAKNQEINKNNNNYKVYTVQTEHKSSKLPPLNRMLPKFPVTKIVINLSNLKLLTTNCENFIKSKSNHNITLTDSTEEKRELMNNIINYEFDKRNYNYTLKKQNITSNDGLINKNKESFTITFGKSKEINKDKSCKNNKKDIMKIKMVRKKKVITSTTNSDNTSSVSYYNGDKRVDLRKITKEYVKKEIKLNDDYLCKRVDERSFSNIIRKGGNVGTSYQRLANYCLFRGMQRRN